LQRRFVLHHREIEGEEEAGDERQHDERPAVVNGLGNHRVGDHPQHRATGDAFEKDAAEGRRVADI